MASTEEEEEGPWAEYSKAPQEAEEEAGPWADFKPEPKVRKPVSPIKSALHGAAQGASFGFSDEGLATLKAAYDKFKEGGNWQDLYNKRLGSERQSVAEAKEDNPLTYTGGLAGGSVLSTMAMPQLGIARGAGLGATLGKAALQGALTGAGESTADSHTPLELLKDTAKGAGTAALTQGIFSGLGGLANKFSPSSLNKFAEERAVKAAVGPNVGNLRNAIGISTKGANPEYVQKRISEMGRNILDEDVLNTLSKTEDLGPALREAAKKYGGEIGEIGQTIDDKLPNAIDPKKLAADLAEYAQTIPETVGGKKLQDRLMAEAANFEEMPSLGFGQAQAMKNQFKYKPVDMDSLISNQDVSNKVRSIIGKNMEDATSQVANSGSDELKDLLQRYQTAKSKYGTFKSASDATGNEVAKDLMRRVVSPSDMATGLGAGITAAIATGNPITLASGILATAAHKFARERGSVTAAVIADNLSKTMQRSPAFAKEFAQIMMDAAQRGPAALTATHLMLMKNPRYSQEFEGQSSSGANEGAPK